MSYKDDITDWTVNFLLHTGYAVCGDVCCDARPSMAWLAKLTNATFGDMNLSDDLDLNDRTTRVRYRIFQYLSDAACRLL